MRFVRVMRFVQSSVTVTSATSVFWKFVWRHVQHPFRAPVTAWSLTRRAALASDGAGEEVA